jgi:hypothetical protein
MGRWQAIALPRPEEQPKDAMVKDVVERAKPWVLRLLVREDVLRQDDRKWRDDTDEPEECRADPREGRIVGR